MVRIARAGQSTNAGASPQKNFDLGGKRMAVPGSPSPALRRPDSSKALPPGIHKASLPPPTGPWAAMKTIASPRSAASAASMARARPSATPRCRPRRATSRASAPTRAPRQRASRPRRHRRDQGTAWIPPGFSRRAFEMHAECLLRHAAVRAHRSTLDCAALGASPATHGLPGGTGPSTLAGRRPTSPMVRPRCVARCASPRRCRCRRPRGRPG